MKTYIKRILKVLASFLTFRRIVVINLIIINILLTLMIFGSYGNKPIMPKYNYKLNLPEEYKI